MTEHFGSADTSSQNRTNHRYHLIVKTHHGVRTIRCIRESVSFKKLDRKLSPVGNHDYFNITTSLESPGVTGYICVDDEGLCLAGKPRDLSDLPFSTLVLTLYLPHLNDKSNAARGQCSQSMSGIIHQIAHLANKIEAPSSSNDQSRRESPVIRIDLENYKLLIQSRDSITTAIASPHK